MNYYQSFLDRLIGDVLNPLWFVDGYVDDHIREKLFFDVDEVDGEDVESDEGKKKLALARERHEILNQVRTLRNPVRMNLPDLYFTETKRRTCHKKMGKMLYDISRHDPGRAVIIIWFRKRLPMFVILPNQIDKRTYDSDYEIYWNKWGIGMPKETMAAVRSITLTEYNTHQSTYNPNTYENKLFSFMYTLFYNALLTRLPDNYLVTSTLKLPRSPDFLFRMIKQFVDAVNAMAGDESNIPIRIDRVEIPHLYDFFDFQWKAPLAGPVIAARYDFDKLHEVRKQFMIMNMSSIFRPDTEYRDAFIREGWEFINSRTSLAAPIELDVTLCYRPPEEERRVMRRITPSIENADVEAES